MALMGRDLLGKLRAQITFDSDGRAALKLRGPEAKILTLTDAQEGEWWPCASKKKILEIPELPFKIPVVQDEDNTPHPGLAQNKVLVVVDLKPGTIPVSQSQYYIPHKAQIGIQKHLNRLLKYGILWPCQSPWNTPLLPIQKPGTENFRPVQDLQCSQLSNCYFTPCSPKPYMIWGLIPAEAKFFTCLDLKNAFFCIHLAPQSQLIFAFQWETSSTGEKGQLTWTQFPQTSKTLPLSLGLPWCQT
jgi:hypothetical protein